MAMAMAMDMRSVSILAVLFFLLRPCHGFNLMNYFCNNGSSYAVNSTYNSNIRSLLASLSANSSSNSGFAKGTLGSGPDAVWGLVLCRGDTNATSCVSCLALAPDVAFDQCRGVKDVSVFYDRCLLRFSSEDFLASPDNGQVQLYGPSKFNITTDPERFDRLVADLIGALANWAASTNSTSPPRYAAGLATSDQAFASTSFQVVHNVYALVQCTPDQSPGVCRRCLEGLRGAMLAAFKGRTGGQINAVWCNLRYEVYPMYDGNPVVKLAESPPAPPPSPAAPEKGNRSSAATVIAIVLGVIVILLSMFTIYLWRNAKKKQYAEKDEDSGSLLFDLSTLRKATANFADENKLGHGGFGAVYKGLLPDGREIAVKRLYETSGQGLEQLRNELLLVAKLRHNNLAKLLGVCLKGQDRLLVYEYLSNRSLDTFLFEPEKREPLDWNTRYQIIYGTARGLLYLHEDSQIRIIHRDLKASNILLDADMNPKISDFGLARLFNSEKMVTLTSQVVGTLGYMAPEYAVLGQMSVKLDVYSFGVLILEIVTGRRNTDGFESMDEHSTLLNYVWNHWTKGTPLEIMDPSLNSEDGEGEELKCIHLGLLCVQENPADRPTMLNVLVMLHSETTSFTAPSKPAFTFAHRGIISLNNTENSGDPANHRATQFSVNEMSDSELHPR